MYTNVEIQIMFMLFFFFDQERVEMTRIEFVLEIVMSFSLPP
jgi:hypothetical protein